MMDLEKPRVLPVRAPDMIVRGAFLAALWGLLTGGDARSWAIGFPVVLAATFVSARLTPTTAWSWSPVAVVRFVVFFTTHSVWGGVDMAWRALHPRLPLAPGFLTLRLRLPPGNARVCLANVVSLLPGTLAAGLEGDTLTLHVVDATAPVERNLRKVEDRVAALFRLSLEPDKEGTP